MKKTLYFLTICLVNLTVTANVTLPKIFSDNMMLQRDVPARVWGWAAKGESVTVTFNNKTVKAKADANGNWSVTLPAMVYGGPFEMTVKGKSNTVTLKNILIGDIWVGSGQSNMEWIINNTNNAEKEIASGLHPGIRLFTVKKATSFSPEKDLAGGEWQECNPQTLGDFSAVAYFFGRKLNQDLNVPIGLINSSWGGTNIQTWTSWDVMGQQEEYKNVDKAELARSAVDQAERLKKYEAALANEPGRIEKWQLSTSSEGWKKTKLPDNFEHSAIGEADGVVWFMKEFDVPAGQKGSDVTISLGPIDDVDETWLNGELIGSEKEWNKDRVYKVAANKLKPGVNRIVVRVYDSGGGGGIYGRPELLFVSIDGKKITLAGEWYYKEGTVTSNFGLRNTGPNAFPSQLYNAMIAPIISFPVKGVIWYQGEANAWEGYRYRTLFPQMITDWRNHWKSNLPFFWVQLANYMAPDSLPAQSDWAELREAQNMTLSLPATGQAVIIDIGEADDIHPRNKQDVGYRLALAAEKVTYNKNIVYTGPVYSSMEKKGNKIVLHFTNTGTGLWAKDRYKYLKGFAIAGNDQRFVWAKAVIEGNTVVVSCDAVPDPVAVRYAWGNNPDDANFYNMEGLPASPFRTDNWKGITKGN